MNTPIQTEQTALVNSLTGQNLTKEDLQSVSALGKELVDREAEIAKVEEYLKLKKEELFTLQTKTLPDAMNEVGLSAITLDTGVALEVAAFYTCSVSDEYPDLKEKALKWLRKNGAGPLIKHEFKVALGVEAEADVKKLRGFLNKWSMEHKDGQAIHFAKLRSFMKERIEAGKEFPMDIFRGYTGKIAKVTKTK